MVPVEPLKDPNLVRRNVVKAGARLAALAAVALTGTRRALAAPPCFLRGTVILTATGERAVEDLQIGDLLVTRSGALRPIKWVGRYPYKRSDASRPWVQDAKPVRITKSALAPNVPDRDLFVTKGHAFFIDGVLVPAGSLVNGKTITVYPSEEFTVLEFFHIKLETHDIILAANAPCETLLGVNENAVNFAEYTRLYGEPVADEPPCFPVLSFCGGRSEMASRMRSILSPLIDRRNKLDVIRDRFEARAETLSQDGVTA